MGDRSGNFSGHANVAPTGKIPGVGEVAALLRFDRLNPAVLAVQEDAGAVRLIDQGQATAIGSQPGVLLDKIILFQAKVPGNGVDLLFGNLHVPRPAATVGAALAEVFGGFFHERKIKMKMKMKVGEGA